MEKFCLKWNDFHSNVSKSFRFFRNEDYLHDVTLVSEDHKQISAHKLVLSACSEYFKDIFRNNIKPGYHHLLCLDGINSDDLNNIMDYIYNGEVQIFQENLDRFLTIAQKFKLEGLMGNDESHQNDHGESEVHTKPEEDFALLETPRKKIPNVPRKKMTIEVSTTEKSVISSEFTMEVNNTVDQQIEKCDDGSLKCLVCGKVDSSRNRRADLKRHVETHLEGLSFPCQLCGKTFRSRNALNIHNTRNHR